MKATYRMCPECHNHMYASRGLWLCRDSIVCGFTLPIAPDPFELWMDDVGTLIAKAAGIGFEDTSLAESDWQDLYLAEYTPKYAADYALTYGHEEN